MKRLTVFAIALSLTACTEADDRSSDRSATRTADTAQPAVAAANVGVARTAVAEKLPSLDDVLARHFEALGGEARLRAATTLTYRGTSHHGDDTVTVAKYYKRGGKLRMEKSGAKGSKVVVVDGERVWKAYKGKVEQLTGHKADYHKRHAAIDDALLTYKADGRTARLVGEATIDGKPAYAVELDMGEHERETRYIDASTYLEVKRVVAWQSEDGKSGETTILFSDYRDVGDGMMINHRADYISERGKGKFIIDHAAYDEPIDDARFAKPAPVH